MYWDDWKNRGLYREWAFFDPLVGACVLIGAAIGAFTFDQGAIAGAVGGAIIGLIVGRFLPIALFLAIILLVGWIVGLIRGCL